MKTPLAIAKTYTFEGSEPYDYGRPLRAMAAWVERNGDKIESVLGINVYPCDENGGLVSVCLTVEVSE